MLKIDTQNYKAIEFEVDGVTYKTKKITNRVIMEGIRITEAMQAKGVSQLEVYEKLVSLLALYTPLSRDFIMDKMDSDNMTNLTTYITDEVTKATGGQAEPPLAGGPSGDESQK